MAWLLGCFRRKKKREFPLHSKKPEFPCTQSAFARSNAFSAPTSLKSPRSEGRDDRVTVRQVLNLSSGCSPPRLEGDELQSSRSQVISSTSVKLLESVEFPFQADDKTKKQTRDCQSPTSPWSQVEDLEREFDKLRRNLRQESGDAKKWKDEEQHSDAPLSSVEDLGGSKCNGDMLQSSDAPVCVSLHYNASSSTEQSGGQDSHTRNCEGSLQQSPASSFSDTALQNEVSQSRNVFYADKHLAEIKEGVKLFDISFKINGLSHPEFDESDGKMDRECNLSNKPCSLMATVLSTHGPLSSRQDDSSLIENLKSQCGKASEDVSYLDTTHESQPHGSSRSFSQKNQKISENNFFSFQSKPSTVDSEASLSCSSGSAESLPEGVFSYRNPSKTRSDTSLEALVFHDCHEGKMEHGDAKTSILCSSPPFSRDNWRQKMETSTSLHLKNKSMFDKIQKQHHDDSSVETNSFINDNHFSDAASYLSVEGRYSHGHSDSEESISMDFSDPRNAYVDESHSNVCMQNNAERTCYANKNVRLRKHPKSSVLTPVANFAQWKQLVEISESEQDVPEEFRSGRRRQRRVARPLHLSAKDFEDNVNDMEKMISVDTSLSHWLRPLPCHERKNQAGTLLTTSEENASEVVGIESPHFTTAESSQHSSKLYESLSPKSPDDRPILGTVAAHWSDELIIAPKWWDGKGIPNSTNKYKEDQKVSWHTTPFEERLEHALANQELTF